MAKEPSQLFLRLLDQYPNATPGEWRAIVFAKCKADPEFQRAVNAESGEMLQQEFIETFGRKPKDFDEFWTFAKHRLKPN
jgi:hypothetical protein